MHKLNINRLGSASSLHWTRGNRISASAINAIIKNARYRLEYLYKLHAGVLPPCLRNIQA